MNINDNEFKQVSLNNKTKFNIRFYLTCALTAILFILMFRATYIREALNYSSFGNFLSNICSLIAIALMSYIWIRYFKNNILKKNKKTSIIIDIEYFLEANQLYETGTAQRYKNNQLVTEKVIIRSACIGYYENNDYIILRAYKNADKFNERMSKLDTGLSSLLGLPIENKRESIRYCDYIFKKQADMRIIISNDDTIGYNNTSIIPLNNNLTWNISKQPHALICGGTGSGKTYFINYLILEFLKKQSDLYICDPKNSDLGQLKSYLGADKVATDGNNIAKICRLTNEAMEQRYTDMNNNNNFVYGSNYIDHNYNPIILIFDELGAFRACADKKTYDETMSYLKAIILKGRQAGVFVILATQQPNANNIPTEIRDNLSMIIALGNMSNQGYQMCFGETVKDLQSISGAGCGYIYLDGKGWEKPRYYEAPYIDKHFDFIEEIKKYS